MIILKIKRKKKENQQKQGKERIPVSTKRHSAAHILAQALKQIRNNVKLAIGPDTENGFFYDVLVDPPLKEEELKELEKKMKHIVKQRQKFVRFTMPIDEAIEFLKEQGEDFKVEMALELKKQGEKELSFYKNVTPDGKKEFFIDMCNGPHVNHTGEIGAFKLVSVSGAYWKGDKNGPQLQRIYGLLFDTQEELNNYEKMMEEAKKRDHRKLGQELEIYTTSEKIGPGLIIWLPRGYIIKDELEKWAKETEEEWGYQRVTTPIVTKEDLFYTSEHLPHYKEHMFPPMELDDGEKYYIKPMNCPFHHTIFAMRPRSYRELPLRLAEYGICHRYEDSGALFGLMRVRSMTMNDAHIYCTEEQAVEEFVKVIELHKYYYDILGIKDYWMELALRNPKNTKYHGNEEMWQKAEALTRKAMEISGVDYVVEYDGAAFYGPKVDFQIKSSIGKVFTASTCQLDLFMPEKFDLKYVDKDGSFKRPVCIHRSPLGTHERFVGFLIEHFAGAFPTWLAPEQIRILPVSEVFLDYCNELKDIFRKHKLRVHIEIEETLAKRIRNSEKMKIPYMIVIGEREKNNHIINVRNYFTGEQKEWEIDTFLNYILEEIKTKRIQERTKKYKE
ncbi:MAG: threonine--tRNA ligase [Leptospiraceae bacterium]|nr:MAG: threonine--tRNA ligase [Leptospiraceae bacterium]